MSSLQTHVLKLILNGELPEAIEYYKLAAGVEQAPRWLLLLQSAFSASNRVAGPCRDVAEKIAEAFRRLGQEPQLVEITSTEGKFLSWHGRILMSDNNRHFAVMISGKIYDAFTGSAGMVWEDYRLAVESRGVLTYAFLK